MGARGRAEASGRLALLQRIGVARIERTDFLVTKATLVDLDARAKQERLRKFLDRIANGEVRRPPNKIDGGECK